VVEQAFTMAELASAAVKVEPMEGYTADLLRLLFNFDGSAARELIESES
jgi:hypothetical protein